MEKLSEVIEQEDQEEGYQRISDLPRRFSCLIRYPSFSMVRRYVFRFCISELLTILYHNTTFKI